MTRLNSLVLSYFDLPINLFYYTLYLCHKRISLKREKGAEPTVFWLDLEPRRGKLFLPEEEKKAEPNSRSRSIFS